MPMHQNFCRALWLILLVITCIAFARILYPTSLQPSLKDNSWRYAETSSVVITNNVNQQLQPDEPKALAEMEQHYSKMSNKRKHNEKTKHQIDLGDMSSSSQTPEAQIQKNDNDAKKRHRNDYTELDFIVKRLNEKYEYEGPGFGKNNFPGLENLSGSLRSKKHKKNKQRRSERDST